MPPNELFPPASLAPEREDAGLTTVRQSLPHDSARLHVTGATYIDDIREPAGTLHVAPGLTPKAAGRIVSLDLSAVRAAPGVVAVITAADLPGPNDIAPVFKDEPIFAESEILYHGQPAFAVVAETRDEARRAAALAKWEIEEKKPVLSIQEAIEDGGRVLPDYDFGRGDTEAALKAAPHRLGGEFHIGGQEHFYLEGQAALAVPGEVGDMLVHSSTQDPTEVQHLVARALAMPDSFITIETRRMGGGFGGKESQASMTAVLAALGARVTNRPCKLRLDRDDDFAMTGKRHDFRADWQVGFDNDGRVSAYDVTLHARCGCSVDMSMGVVDRSMFHAGNTYWLPDVAIRSTRLKTNTVSATAFRGFGGPQGMVAIERAMDAIAQATGRDPLDVRKSNFVTPGRDLTPYGMKVEDLDTLHTIVERLEVSSDYRARRAEIAAFNRTSPIIKKGLALTPVQFGISFTLIHLNQAGALVHVYQDGSIHLNHGGTEMGQGLFIKVAQVVAEEFGVPIDWVRITATNTAKVPNTSATAASSGTDLNGMAARIAARQIRDRMTAFAAAEYGAEPETIDYRDGRVIIGNNAIGFGELAKKCRQNRVQLSCAGYYRTPEISWDREKRQGQPFFYFAYGAACSEVAIDTLTGEMKVSRVDILHDVGRAINPALDKGQIEGGFVQGMGWLTTEELVWDRAGKLSTHAPSTYKIPVASDVPEDFRVELHQDPNRAATIYRSKAVGEPPFMLGISVFSAVLDALHSLSPGVQAPLEAPATPERILMAAQAMMEAR